MTDRVWQDLVGYHRRPGGCDDLAAAAQSLLKARESVRDSLTGIHRNRFIDAFIGEITSRLIMMPVEAHLAAAARGLQIAGICVCVLGGDLAHCACLLDVLKAEGQERVEALVSGAMEDWRGLPRRMRDTPGP
ncbi:hypothetical protein [Streptomyces sp. NPDC051576]|uniref:hypothetical protein n=1 Tax=Streptomyces sp. NPDC051576 TaxID=3155803 RepID=UPI0034458392